MITLLKVRASLYVFIGVVMAGFVLIALAADLSNEDAASAYRDLLPEMQEGYIESGLDTAKEYTQWRRFNTVPYRSSTHGNRYVNNYANAAAAETYAKFEQLTTMPVGSLLAKDSFQVNKQGEIKPGPLFLMEKMEPGFNQDSKDWRYTLIFPNGKIQGVTNGEGSKKVAFCFACHLAQGGDTDSMTFLPQEYRQ